METTTDTNPTGEIPLDEAPPAPEPDVNVPDTELEDDEYQCSGCERKFATKRGRSKHFQSMHGGIAKKTTPKTKKAKKPAAKLAKKGTLPPHKQPAPKPTEVPERALIALLADIVAPRMGDDPSLTDVIDFAGEIIDGLHNASVLFVEGAV